MWHKQEAIRITAVQHPSVFLDLDKSVAWACELIAQTEAELIVFPETWLPGYPVWLDVAPGAGLWDHEPATAVFRQLFLNSVTIPSPATDRLCAAAQAVVVMGLHEREGGTLYNTMLFVGPDGCLTLDVTGHYGRPDIFQLHINRQPQTNVQWHP